eukprot:gene13329-15672_t
MSLDDRHRHIGSLDSELMVHSSRVKDLQSSHDIHTDELFRLKDIYGITRFDGLPEHFGAPMPRTHDHKVLMQYGLPSQSNLWFYEHFVVSANQERRIPSWVLQRIEGDVGNKAKVSDRKKAYFNSNIPHVPAHLRADNRDYLGSGWSRGHMVPAGDMQAFSQTAMGQTFLLNDNIVPQDLQNNCNFWYRLEVFCKSTLPAQFAAVNVVSGPLFLPTVVEPIDLPPENPDKPSRFPRKSERRYVKHEVIGENNVAVPTHLFKVILTEPQEAGGKMLLGAFVIPNEPIPSDATLMDYQVSLNTIERMSGLTFFPKVNPANTAPLCDSIECQVMTERQLEIWNIPRRISWSRNRKELDKVLEDVVQWELDTNSSHINKALTEKLKELEAPSIEAPSSN